MIGIARSAARLFARLERRHWAGVGASAAMHLAVFLGWQAAPPPEPEAISFEVSFDPPDSATLATETAKPLARKVPTNKIARKTRPQPPASAPTPDAETRREAHLLDANWRAEQTAARDAPALTLPDARNLGLQFDTAPITRTGDARPTPPAAPLAVSAARPAAETRMPISAGGAGGAELVEPQAASVGGRNGQPAEAGLALAHATALAASRNFDSPAGGAGAQASNANLSLAAAAVSGQSDVRAELNAALAAQTARNVGAGTGSQADVDGAVAARAVASQGELQGLRLAASGVLSNSPSLPRGEGALASNPQAEPLAAGGAQSGTAALALRGSANDSATGIQPVAARSGSALTGYSESGVSRAGRGAQAGGDLVATTTAPSPASAGVLGSGRPGSAMPVATAVALKPGEPGSRPNLAVAMQPVVASAPDASGGRVIGAERTAAGREPTVGFGRAQPASAGGGVSADISAGRLSGASIQAAAVSGGQPGMASRAGEMSGGQLAASRAAASAALLEAARESGRAPMVLRAIQPVAVQVVRPDSEIQRLDVLAPSNYCPLPLPGHEQPDNRAPLPERRNAEQPAYAPDNPSIHYPVLANIRGVEGRVTVRVEVLSDGRPGKMWLKQSSGSGILDQDALAQLKTWRYLPARRNGQPVSAWIDVPVLYRLSQTR